MDEWDEPNLFERLGGRETGNRMDGRDSEIQTSIFNRKVLIKQTPTEWGFPTQETLQDIVFELYDLMRALVPFFLKVLVALDGFKCCQIFDSLTENDVFFCFCVSRSAIFDLLWDGAPRYHIKLNKFVINKQIAQNDPQTCQNLTTYSWRVASSSSGVDSLLGPQFDRFAKTDGTFHRLKVRTVDWLEWNFGRLKMAIFSSRPLVSSDRRLQEFWKPGLFFGVIYIYIYDPGLRFPTPPPHPPPMWWPCPHYPLLQWLYGGRLVALKVSWQK